MLQVWQTWKKLGLDVGILHVARRREAKAKVSTLRLSCYNWNQYLVLQYGADALKNDIYRKDC